MIKKLFLFIVIILCTYAVSQGVIKSYYALTDGFRIANITSDHSNDLPLKNDFNTEEVRAALQQEFTYLGKGCQSYVFESADGQYVIKFIKFQRYRPKPWYDLLTFIPTVKQYQDRKRIEKREELDNLLRSWHLGFTYLKEQTGVIFIHFGQRLDYELPICTLKDKLNLKHFVDLSQVHFMLQRKADLLEKVIDRYQAKCESGQARLLIDELLTMLFLEYQQGFADNDHALMQNTGVLDGLPIHIDVGQLIYNKVVQHPLVQNREIYNKTYLLHRWLRQKHPALAEHLKMRLIAIIGMDYYFLGEYVHKQHIYKIPDESLLMKKITPEKLS